MKCLLVGYGEIGRAVHEVYGKTHDIDIHDPGAGHVATGGEYELLLVAIPYTDDFVQVVKRYQFEHNIEHTLIFSTTAIGTCRQLEAVHCPIEGKHPNLAESVRVTERWLGGRDRVAECFFYEADKPFCVLDEPEHTEFLKLRSTTVYGLNIEFARYCKRVADDIGLDYRECNNWDEWYNALYVRNFAEYRFTRPILTPPDGAKGGHCVTPNARILNGQYPDALVARVAEDDL